MKKKLCLLILAALVFTTSCGESSETGISDEVNESKASYISEEVSKSETSSEVDYSAEIDSSVEEFSVIESDYTVTGFEKTQSDNIVSIKQTVDGSEYEAQIEIPENAEVSVNAESRSVSVVYGGTEEEITFVLRGTLYGSISLTISEDTNAVLELNGMNIISDISCPLYISGGNNIDISAKSETENKIYDNRSEAEELASAIYCENDLKLKGTGKLYVYSENNNGIHCKDDVKVQKLSLYVNCVDNALKGNDSVDIVSGEITLIARQGDGIKTSSTDISEKQNQKGDITVEDGTLKIYAACDGIDAACDVNITGGSILVYTGTNSSYSETVTDKTTQSGSSSTIPGFGVGNWGGKGGGGGGGRGGGGGWGGGGMDGGNTNKTSYSTKGIKSGNEINIEGGTIEIKSTDDGIHANNETALESGATPMGNVNISGGNITIYANDDGIHGDGKVTVSGGCVDVCESYEGIEGNVVEIAGGDVTAIASDDGINGTATTGEAIIISGGKLYVYAGGDGVDSNSKTSYDGMLISGGYSVVINTSGGNSSLDTERGYKYTGGMVVSVGLSGGMTSETTMCQNFSKIGYSKTLTVKSGAYLCVEDVAVIKMPRQLSAFIAVLGDTDGTISSSSSCDYTLDSNGVYWFE